MIGTGTTWGLTGAEFLWLYAALSVVVAVTIRWKWQQALGPRPHADNAVVDAYRVAMLNGGPQLAITAAATRLHKDGVLRDGEGSRTLVVDGRIESNADTLEWAVVQAVEREPNIKTSVLRRELEQSEPVKRLVTRLADVGLLVKPEVSAKLRRLWLWGAALVAFGAIRIWGGVVDDAAVGYLVVLVIAVAFATVWLAFQRPWATARGQALVARQRTSRRDLRTGGGVSDLHLAVALYGGALLWTAEPAIASAWNVPRESEATNRGGGCGGGWAGGGGAVGGGGGGGGCGGGCGGGG
jgi:uncharacterized protein (TIGR04222 family)